jgi:DNA-binding PadR family transcriptional regulator
MERELLLLGLLRQHEMHGYQLADFINNNLASCTDLKKPTAYHLLDKMEERGWLTSIASSDNNRPTKKVYQISLAGEAAFQDLLRQNLATYMGATFGGNIGLAFMDALPTEEALQLLENRRSQLANELLAMQAVPAHHGSMALVIEHQLYHLQSEVHWLENLIQRYTKGEIE